jgi:hypothetical protein
VHPCPSDDDKKFRNIVDEIKIHLFDQKLQYFSTKDLKLNPALKGERPFQTLIITKFFLFCKSYLYFCLPASTDPAEPAPSPYPKQCFGNGPGLRIRI